MFVKSMEEHLERGWDGQYVQRKMTHPYMLSVTSVSINPELFQIFSSITDIGPKYKIQTHHKDCVELLLKTI